MKLKRTNVVSCSSKFSTKRSLKIFFNVEGSEHLGEFLCLVTRYNEKDNMISIYSPYTLLYKAKSGELINEDEDSILKVAKELINKNNLLKEAFI